MSARDLAATVRVGIRMPAKHHDRCNQVVKGGPEPCDCYMRRYEAEQDALAALASLERQAADAQAALVRAEEALRRYGRQGGACKARAPFAAGADTA